MVAAGSAIRRAVSATCVAASIASVAGMSVMEISAGSGIVIKGS